MFSLAIAYMATGSRGGVIAPILMACGIWSLHHRRLPYIGFLIIGIFALAVVGIGGEFRTATRGAQDVRSIEVSTGFLESIEEGFKEFTKRGAAEDGGYGIIGNVPESVDYLYGRSYWSIPLAIIPQMVLPFDKPLTGGKLNADYIYGNPLGAMPPGNIGEAYWNFGVPGVIMVMFVFGCVMRWFERLYTTNGAAGWVVGIYIAMLFSLQPNSPAFHNFVQAVGGAVIFLIFFCGVPKLVRVPDNAARERRGGVASKILDLRAKPGGRALARW